MSQFYREKIQDMSPLKTKESDQEVQKIEIGSV